MPNTPNELRVVYGDEVIGVHGADFSVFFDTEVGGMSSLVVAGKEWLYAPPVPTVWRASTDNDRFNGFAVKAGQWFAADNFRRVVRSEILVDGAPIALPITPAVTSTGMALTAQTVTAAFDYELAINPAVTVTVTYTVTPAGRITAHAHYAGQPGLPPLPVFGLRFVLPTPATGFTYAGLSGETYPDRQAGGVPGVYEFAGMPVAPHLKPQDCGLHVGTQWVRVTRETTLSNVTPTSGPFALTVRQTKAPFAFSCLPYLPAELEVALHQEELPPISRTVFTAYGAVSDVGTIDGWGDEEGLTHRVDSASDQDVEIELLARDGAED